MTHTSLARTLAVASSISLLLVFALMHIHAPMTVWLGTLVPDYSLLIKAWKEILLLTTVPTVIIAAWKFGIIRELAASRLMLLIAAYAVLHLALVAVFRPGTMAALAGLIIDLRYLLFFVLAYAVALMLPQFRRHVLMVSALGAVVVLLFGLLQVFVLPVDILASIGYSNETIQPYLTIDKNRDFIRINSTMRGPNPLGAYVMAVTCLLLAFLLRQWLSAKPKLSKHLLTVASLLAATPFVLYASHSRSAWLAVVVGGFLVAGMTIGRRLSLRWWLILLFTPLLLFGSGVYALKDTETVANVLEHRNPDDPMQDNSNEGHISSLVYGTRAALMQPLGAGPGSTGSASLHSDNPLIIENHYLFVAHEVGWLGLALFLAISVLVLRFLWLDRDDWLCAGLFAAGIGLMVIGLLLPVWADDTVSLLWWGLSAVAIGSHQKTR